MKSDVLYALLLQRIESGEVPTGSSLPTERDLQAQLNVSRTTIRRVLSRLEQEGRLVRRKGCRPVVPPPPVVPSRPNQVITLIAGNEATYKPFGDIYRGCKAIVARYGATFRSIDTQAESDLSVLERQQREHDALQQLLASPVSGVIIWCQFPQLSLPLLQRLRDAGTAVVAIDRELPGGQFDYVGSNNRRGAEQAVEYLCQKGHRRIAFVTPVDDEVSTVFDREEGFLRAVYRRQDSVRGSVLRLPFRASDDEIFTALRPLMSSIDPPTGIFAMNDFYAQGVVRALRTAGTRVPQEVAVVGFDDIETPLGLTTIHQPFQEIGEAAVRRILMRLHYPDAAVCQLLLSTRLMERDTT